MPYNAATDFIGLWRSAGGNVSKLEMPGLDYVVSALARAGIVNLSVSATAPVANQSTTAWLQAAVPSFSAEGALQLWNPVTSAYAPATPALFLAFLEACAGQTGVSWFTTTGGAPLNTVGNNGDFAIRTDEPGGIYGPKTLGAWPATPVPGTTDTIGSTQLDLTFGNVPGQLIYRGPAAWQALPIGATDTVLTSVGSVPTWDGLSALLDALFGSVQGDILYRGASAWAALPPGVAAQVLATGGPGANPAWAPRTAEFASGTVMLFQQTAAPVGWTKQVILNDYGLRVTSGAVGTTTGTAFSTIFAQTAVGNTTLSLAQMPIHTHTLINSNRAIDGNTGSGIGGGGAFGAATNSMSNAANGSSTSHTHSINLSLSYVDVIIASKN